MKEVDEVRVVFIGRIRVDVTHRFVTGGDGNFIKLTGAQHTALEILALSQGQVVHRDALSMAALGRPWRQDDRSVDQLIMALRTKLGDYRGLPLIETIRGRGYLLRRIPVMA